MSNDTKDKKNTNFCDVLIALINGIFNLLKIEKVISILVLYLLWRDFIFIQKLKENVDVSEYLIDTKIIEHIFESDNNILMVLLCIIAILLAIIFFQIFYVRKIYLKEIDRLCEERKSLIHGLNDDNMEIIKKHKSSKA